MKYYSVFFGVLVSASNLSLGEAAGASSKTHVIKLPLLSSDYFEIIKPPKSNGMRSGLVTLEPQKSVGKHGTGEYEELIVVLEGKGEMTVTGGGTFKFVKGETLYAAPNTEHDVLNVGTTPLKIYLCSCLD